MIYTKNINKPVYKNTKSKNYEEQCTYSNNTEVIEKNPSKILLVLLELIQRKFN